MLRNRRFRFTWRYLRGHTPWDSGIVPPEVVAWVDTHPTKHAEPGRALDVGCGTGTTSLFLAEHGWEVVGVDFAPNAVWRARRKARRAGLTDRVTFHSADVSRLGFLTAKRPFDLLIDIGCLHGVPHAKRPDYAAHLARLARPGATFLLYAWEPFTRDNGMRMGIDRDGLHDLVGPAFTIADYTPGREVTVDVGSAWYTLQRTDDTP
ncbi:MAG: class I SAM-dependent methyltransferase [Chloroflexi bacterium]|nr:class I SAM-dependent methyltransferase [Chloroflexota bacterium]